MAPRAPWGIAFPARRVARLLLIRRGSCWLSGAGLDEPRALGTNDCFLVQAGVTFQLADCPGRTLLESDDLESDDLESDDLDGTTEIVSSRFTVDALAADALFDLLPPIFQIDVNERAGEQLRATFDLIAKEYTEGALGSAFIAARLSDVLFIQALRACPTGPGGSLGWLAAVQDPLLAPVIERMQTSPTPGRSPSSPARQGCPDRRSPPRSAPPPMTHRCDTSRHGVCSARK